MPGGDSGESASNAPSPKKAVTTTATAVSRPIPGTRPTSAIATAATAIPGSRRPGSASRRAPRAPGRGRARVRATPPHRRRRRRSTQQPSAPLASEINPISSSALRMNSWHSGSVTKSIISGGGPGGSRLGRCRGSRRSPRRRWPRGPRDRGPSSGLPKAICRLLRQSTSSQRLAWPRSWVAMTIPRPSRGKLGDQALKALGGRDVEPGEGLIEKQQLSVLHQPSRDQNALALAAGEIAEGVHRARRDTDPLQGGQRGAAILVAGPPPPRKPRQGAHQGDVERRDREVEPGALGLGHGRGARRGHRPSRASAAARRAATRISVVLPPPLGPSSATRCPGVDLEAHLLDRRLAAVAGREILGFWPAPQPSALDLQPLLAIREPLDHLIGVRLLHVEIGVAAGIGRSKGVAIERVVRARARLGAIVCASFGLSELSGKIALTPSLRTRSARSLRSWAFG